MKKLDFEMSKKILLAIHNNLDKLDFTWESHNSTMYSPTNYYESTKIKSGKTTFYFHICILNEHLVSIILYTINDIHNTETSYLLDETLIVSYEGFDTIRHNIVRYLINKDEIINVLDWATKSLKKDIKEDDLFDHPELCCLG